VFMLRLVVEEQGVSSEWFPYQQEVLILLLATITYSRKFQFCW